MPQIILESSPVASSTSFDSYSRRVALPSLNCAFVCNDLVDLCALNQAEQVYTDDKIFLTFKFPDVWNDDPGNIVYRWFTDGTVPWFLKAEIVDKDGNVIAGNTNINDVASGYLVGFKDDKPFQQLIIDVSKLTALSDEQCFAIKITLKLNPEDENDQQSCYYGFYQRFAKTYNEAVDSNCDPEMVLIEGVYKGYDCDGNFYGLPDSYAGNYNADNRIQMRWAGYFESTGFAKEITENDDEYVTNVAIREKAILRFKHMHYEKAKLLAIILSADKIFVNGEEWVEKKGFEKNHQLSKEWLPDIEFDRPICDRSTLDCDF